MIRSQLIDPRTGRGAKINGEGELSVVVHPHPPVDEETSAVPIRKFFTSDGTSSGSSDFRVDGSSSNQDFYIGSDSEKDVYIKTISVFISDPGSNLQDYGALSALTNGVQFIWRTSDLGITTIADSIKTNLEWMRLALGNPSFGTGTDVFKADLSGGGADAYLPVVDLALVFGLPFGLRLRKGTTDRIIIRIRDNLSTGIVEHNAIGYGIKI